MIHAYIQVLVLNICQNLLKLFIIWYSPWNM